MRVLSWTFWRSLLWKSDDALARAMPLAQLALPEHQLRLVVPDIAAPAPLADTEPVQVEQAPGAPSPGHPLAKQLAVQRHLTRISKRKRPKFRLKAKTKSKTSRPVARRNASAVNRPSSKRAAAAKRSAGKKRIAPRRHVWLSPNR